MTNTHGTAVNEQVGELVHTHMWRQKVTQTRLATHLGVGQPAIAKKVRGERPFTIDELLAVAAYLDLPITELLPNAGLPHPGAPDGGGESAPTRARTEDPKLKRLLLSQLSYGGETDDTQRPEQPAAETDNRGTADYKSVVLTFPTRTLEVAA